MLQDSTAIRLLDNVTIPDALIVRVADNSDEFLNLNAQLNSSAPLMWGTAYRQGGRLHFSTAMSVSDYCGIIRIDQAPKGSTTKELEKHTNRPAEVAHGKGIHKYLTETACEGGTWIFPSFILNYGLHHTEDQARAELVIFAGNREALSWPAIFAPPTAGRLPVTDGGHRSREIQKVLASAAAGRFPENAISVVFVFESDLHAYRQDFADCAKSKPVSNSLQDTWDRRDAGRKFGIDLVENNVHLQRWVDATSNSVNLSSNSAKCWSMSAVQSAVMCLHTTEKGPGRLSKYFDMCFAQIPILVDIETVKEGEPPVTPAYYRNLEGRGGCVLLRGVGVAVLVQGFMYALDKGIALEEMAGHLAKLDWHVIKPDAAPQQDGQFAYAYVEHAAHKIWMGMLAMMANDTKFRIKGTRDSAKNAFDEIVKELGI